MTLVCASVMLGIMGIYRITGVKNTKTIDSDVSTEKIVFKNKKF